MAVENFDGIQQQEETIDLRVLFYKFVRYWYLFALTVFVAFVVAFLFNSTRTPFMKSALPSWLKMINPNSILQRCLELD